MPHPCAFVIFGAAGDLSRRKLLPALFRLWRGGHLNERTALVGSARREWDDDAFKNEVADSLREFIGADALQDGAWEQFARRLFFVGFDMNDPNGYERLKRRLETLDKTEGVGRRRVFYLATPPQAFALASRQLDAAGLAQTTRTAEGAWPRIVVEKPFGRDLASSKKLDAELLSSFDEERIYRIDHYLGKEMAQNLMVFRFGNTIFESIWNRNWIDHVQIAVAETIGVENRGKTYEQMGAARDIVQNHIMQLLATVAMEPPSRFDGQRVRAEKTTVIEAIRPVDPESAETDFVRAQYIADAVDGRPVKGYRQENEVASDSLTETYMAGKFYIETWRWSGVPFYIRTGKRLSQRATEASIHFKEPPMALFHDCGGAPGNVLTMRIQPDEGISLSIDAKKPGVAMALEAALMAFRYSEAFPDRDMPDAYETLIMDVIMGDSMLFAPSEMHAAAWAVLDPLLTAWESPEICPLDFYPAGAAGPQSANAIMQRDGRQWSRFGSLPDKICDD